MLGAIEKFMKLAMGEITKPLVGGPVALMGAARQFNPGGPLLG